MKKLLIFVLLVTTIMTACSTNAPMNAYEGVWEPVDGEFESCVITHEPFLLLHMS